MKAKKDRVSKEGQKPEKRYSEDEKVLCFHGPLLYEAKIHDIKFEEDEWKYYVHYHGWNRSWDEWVNDARIMRFDEAGLKKREELVKHFKAHPRKTKSLRKSDLKNQLAPPPEAMEQIGKAVKESSSEEEDEEEENEEEGAENSSVTTSQSSKRASKSANKSSNSVSKKKNKQGGATTASSTGSKGTSSQPETASTSHTSSNPKPPQNRKRSLGDAESQANSLNTSASAPLRAISSDPHHMEMLKLYPLNLTYPENIRQWLIDDWDKINRLHKVHVVPARVTVSQLLEHYKSHDGILRSDNEPVDDMIEEFTAGVKNYFDLLLPTKLLYKFERNQFAELERTHNQLMSSDFYGATHLMRLFVKLKDLIPYTKVDEAALKILGFMSNDFLGFLSENLNTYYPNSLAAYIKRG